MPVLYDINLGSLPFKAGGNFDGFYARSSLHVGDERVLQLVKTIDRQLKPGGKVLVLGKSPNDRKIQRSKRLEDGLAVDYQENGHIRRVWTPKFMKEMCRVACWELLSIDYNSEVIDNGVSEYITMTAKKHE